MPDGTVRRRAAGALLLACLPAAAVAAALSPRVREPVARVLRTVGRDLVARGPDVTLAAATTEGVRVGDPAFLLDDAGRAVPVAHVVAVTPSALGLAFGRPEDAARAWRAQVHARGESLRDVIALAVPEATARALREDLLARARRAWREALAPDLRARLPALWARLDPAADEETRRLVSAVGDRILEALAPLGDDLAGAVAKALSDRFDLLQRLGLLWRFVRGDAEGLKRRVLPAAEEAARAWWSEHRADVLRAVGSGLTAETPRIEAWVEGRLLAAAEEAVVGPLLAANAERLEQEGRAWLERVVADVALAPGGGFRRRFATVLRHHLLDKDDALVLLERAD